MAANHAKRVTTTHRVATEWGHNANRTQQSLPIDRSLGRHPELSQPVRGSRLVHVQPASGSPDDLVATIDDGDGLDPGTLNRRVRRAIPGPPLRSTAIVQERMRKLIALPVLSADSLSSAAYGPEALRRPSCPSASRWSSGLIDEGRRGFPSVPAPVLRASQGVTLLLVLRVFASGSTAMTGIEAISNAVPSFRPVEWRNSGPH